MKDLVKLDDLAKTVYRLAIVKIMLLVILSMVKLKKYFSNRFIFQNSLQEVVIVQLDFMEKIAPKHVQKGILVLDVSKNAVVILKIQNSVTQ